MPINSLQQQAFASCSEFQLQVQSRVKEEALKYASALPQDDANRAILERVVKYPDQFIFAPTIVADYDWTDKFDPWAENPTSLDGGIQTFVTKWFGLLTGYYPPAP